MSNYYRQTYLKSEHWQNLRLQKLVESDCLCLRCGKQSQHHDVHHLNYKKLYDVTTLDLVVLCRTCHDLVHEKLDQVKLLTEEDPNEKAFSIWKLFLETWGPHPNEHKELREQMILLRKRGAMRNSPKPKKPPQKHRKKTILLLDPEDFMVYDKRASEAGLYLSDWVLIFLREKIGF